MQVLSVYIAIEKARVMTEECEERHNDRRKTDQPMNRIRKTTNMAQIGKRREVRAYAAACTYSL